MACLQNKTFRFIRPFDEQQPRTQAAYLPRWDCVERVQCSAVSFSLSLSIAILVESKQDEKWWLPISFVDSLEMADKLSFVHCEVDLARRVRSVDGHLHLRLITVGELEEPRCHSFVASYFPFSGPNNRRDVWEARNWWSSHLIDDKVKKTSQSHLSPLTSHTHRLWSLEAFKSLLRKWRLGRRWIFSNAARQRRPIHPVSQPGNKQ